MPPLNNAVRDFPASAPPLATSLSLRLSYLYFPRLWKHSCSKLRKRNTQHELR